MINQFNFFHIAVCPSRRFPKLGKRRSWANGDLGKRRLGQTETTQQKSFSHGFEINLKLKKRTFQLMKPVFRFENSLKNEIEKNELLQISRRGKT